MLTVIEEELAPGVCVRGYRLERELGEGGMGVVWAAIHEVSRARVALKFVRPALAGAKSTLARFAREARSAMAIDHPNVVKVTAVLETDWGLPFLVMEWLEGESLRGRLVARGRVDLDEARRVLVAVAEGLAAAHARGIVHRDVKPENVFLTVAGEVKVLDFGIAKRVSNGASAETLSATDGGFVGTPYYMAPEQVFGDGDVDWRVDVWALGIVLYECLAGRRPTDGPTFGQVLKRITTDPLEPLERAASGLPREVTSLVGRMLARDRMARPPLAEVRAVLARVVDRDDEPPSSAVTVDPARAPAVTTSGASGAGQRRPLLAVTAVVLALGLGGALVGGALFRRGPSADDRLRAQDAAQGVTGLIAARDGRECLRRLDEHDRLDPTPASLSTDPMTGLGMARVHCLMLAGRCEDGRAMLHRWYAASDAGMNIEATEHAIDGWLSAYCEGDTRDLSARDRALVLGYRLMKAEAGSLPSARPATSAECRAWYTGVRDALAALPPRPDASMDGVRATYKKSTMACLARASDCAGAFAMFVTSRGRSEADVRADPAALEDYRRAVADTGCRAP